MLIGFCPSPSPLANVANLSLTQAPSFCNAADGRCISSCDVIKDLTGSGFHDFTYLNRWNSNQHYNLTMYVGNLVRAKCLRYPWASQAELCYIWETNVKILKLCIWLMMVYGRCLKMNLQRHTQRPMWEEISANFQLIIPYLIDMLKLVHLAS